MNNFNDLIFSILVVIFFVFVTIIIFLLAIKRIKADQARIKQQELQHQKEILINTIRVQEEEKKKIAAELHDHFGVSLNTVRILIEESGDCIEPVLFDKIRHLIQRSINDVRDLSHEISPPMLEHFGIEATLQDVASNLKSQLKIEVKVIGKAIPYWESLQLFRICQEFIQNTLKHSQAETLNIIIRNSDNFLSMSLNDDGCGFRLGKKINSNLGHGLKSMKSRAESIYGQSKIVSSESKGTRFILLKKYDD
ncbi:sensor histidine kinase [Aureibacter tunicatorum]|uniref:histidine kinase n=1 Tax=Aureibacter tunicatorum TaxID=866807 RepID=A0AAE3XTU7_9BACT|nr:ATP-binding protein [Aureibacter tunicatorum]MDR6241579.1 signal transduction histidine kinase [Aureibacter tunicatorum]BDD07197.1 hypothetical protein AUTU_46800 [Aureibacter tunicatorum]